MSTDELDEAAKHLLNEFNRGHSCADYELVCQGGNPQYRAAWAKICDVSRKSFDQVYKRLKVTLEEKVTYSSLIFSASSCFVFLNQLYSKSYCSS